MLADGQAVFWASDEHGLPQRAESWYSYALVPGTHFLLASPGFANISTDVREAVADPERLQRIGEAAARFADTQFSDTCIRSFMSTVVRRMHEAAYAKGRAVEKWQCPDTCRLFEFRSPDGA